VAEARIARRRNRVYVTSQQGLWDRNLRPNFLLTETYMDMRKRVILFAFLTAIYLPSYAGVNGGKAVYMGGTVSAYQAPAPTGSETPGAKLADFRLEDGTPIKLRLSRTISSSDAQVNDKVDFEVLEEVKVDGTAVIPKGSVAWGTVTEAQSKRRMARGGKLDMNIDDVRLVDGEKAALRAVKGVKGGGHTGGMTAGIVATSLIVWPAAPFFLFMHGKDVTIPKGTEITAYINGDFNLDRAKFGSNLANRTPLVAGGPSNDALSTVEMKSAPDGADISVDGKFVGNTPSTVRLQPGDHKITIEKSGFKPWERTMSVGPGATLTINPTLEQLPKPAPVQ